MRDFVYSKKTGVIKMGKIRQWLRKWFDKALERSMQRQANKYNIQYKNGNYTIKRKDNA